MEEHRDCENPHPRLIHELLQPTRVSYLRFFFGNQPYQVFLRKRLALPKLTIALGDMPNEGFSNGNATVPI